MNLKYKLNIFIILGSLLITYIVGVSISICNTNSPELLSMPDVISAHTVYTIFCFPLGFGFLFHFSPVIMKLAVILYWPIVLFFTYKLFTQKELLYLIIIVLMLLAPTPFWFDLALPLIGV